MGEDKARLGATRAAPSNTFSLNEGCYACCDHHTRANHSFSVTLLCVADNLLVKFPGTAKTVLFFGPKTKEELEGENRSVVVVDTL